jgi:ATP-dependent Lon protease
MGIDGVEQFVSTPELHSDEAIEADPLPPGQVWAISPGGEDAAPSLYRIEATSGLGGGAGVILTRVCSSATSDALHILEP